MSCHGLKHEEEEVEKDDETFGCLSQIIISHVIHITPLIYVKTFDANCNIIPLTCRRK